MESSDKPPFRIEWNHSDTLFLDVTYDLSKIIELLEAHFLHWQSNNEYEKALILSKCLESGDSEKWHSFDAVAKETESEPIDLLSWYRNLRNQDWFNDHSEKVAQAACRAEQMFRQLLSQIIKALLTPAIIASVQCTNGQAEEGAELLLRNIQEHLGRNLRPLLNQEKLEIGQHIITENLGSGLLRLSFTDDFGGRIVCYYDYIPRMRELYRQVNEASSILLSKFIEKHEKSDINQETSESLRQALSRSRELAVKKWFAGAAGTLIDSLPEAIRDSLTLHIGEAMYATVKRPLQIEDESGENIILSIDSTALLKSIKDIAQKRMKSRIRAPKRGGATRKPEFNWSDDKMRTQFVERVDKLRHLWEKALNEEDEMRWGDGWLDMLKGNNAMTEISSTLLREALNVRAASRSNGKPIALDQGPLAYALKQAAQELDIKKSGQVYAFVTLRKYYDGTLPAIKRNKTSS